MSYNGQQTNSKLFEIPVSPLAALLLVGLLAACNEKAPSRAPQPQKVGATNNPETPPTGTNNNNDGTPILDDLGIEPSDTAQTWEFAAGQSIEVEFTLTGVGNRDVSVGLMEAPSGLQLQQSGRRVTLSWSVPSQGDHDIQFLLRDEDACREQENDDSGCVISASDFGQLTQQSYDEVSQVYTLTVGNGSNLGGNGNIISQIMGLLGGQGGSGLSALLGGMDPSQLGQILQMLQGGGDIGQIIALITGGMSLNGESSPPPVDADSTEAPSP